MYLHGIFHVPANEDSKKVRKVRQNQARVDKGLKANDGREQGDWTINVRRVADRSSRSGFL